VAGMAGGVAAGRPDDLPRLAAIVAQLRGERQFLLRTYAPYSGEASAAGIMQLLELCARSGERWDFVLSFRLDGAELDGWLRTIGEIVERYGKVIDSLQITNEPNLMNVPHAGDGSWPNVRRALQDGVIAAKEAARACGASVSIGFNAVPTFESGGDFWAGVRGFGSQFAQSLDYVGIDFYPDVFGAPVSLEQLPSAVEQILREFRRDMAGAGLPESLPLRIAENGWATGPDRPYERQAQVLEANIRTVHRLCQELNITHYELFGLRDADSSNENSFFQFGILRDDYTPKPAFEVYRRLVQELGR
jgi:hypothetical protein